MPWQLPCVHWKLPFCPLFWGYKGLIYCHFLLKRSSAGLETTSNHRFVVDGPCNFQFQTLSWYPEWWSCHHVHQCQSNYWCSPKNQFYQHGDGSTSNAVSACSDRTAWLTPRCCQMPRTEYPFRMQLSKYSLGYLLTRIFSGLWMSMPTRHRCCCVNPQQCCYSVPSQLGSDRSRRVNWGLGQSCTGSSGCFSSSFHWTEPGQTSHCTGSTHFTYLLQ